MRHRKGQDAFDKAHELDYIADEKRWLEQLDLQNREDSQINWLDETHRISANLRDIHYQLKRLSNAFYAVGNDKVAEELELIARTLEVEGRNVSTLASIKITGDLREAEQGTANILTALLGGVKMGQADAEAKNAKEEV